MAQIFRVSQFFAVRFAAFDILDMAITLCVRRKNSSTAFMPAHDSTPALKFALFIRVLLEQKSSLSRPTSDTMRFRFDTYACLAEQSTYVVFTAMAWQDNVYVVLGDSSTAHAISKLAGIRVVTPTGRSAPQVRPSVCAFGL